MRTNGFSTRSIHDAEKPLQDTGEYGDVVVPIHLTTTFARREPETATKGMDYSRTGNPTRQALERKLASLEQAKYGLAFASGLAAEAAVIMALLRSGDTVIAGEDLYGGTRRLLVNFGSRFGIHVKFADLSNPENLLPIITKETKMIWCETPSNPFLKITPLREVSKFSSEHGILTVADNTFASPFFQNPIQLGCDVVVHSTTKYIGGHSDTIGGAVVTDSEQIFENVKFFQNAAGGIMSPFDSYLTLRGVKTLSARMAIHARNAKSIANLLASSGKASEVFYPGLDSHPLHKVAAQQMSGFGGMVSVRLDTDLKGVRRFLKGLELFSLAESLGGVESLIEVPSMMTHLSVPPEERKRLGIDESLIRISAGIEDEKDLLEDLSNALALI
jgi:cystathionine gamma-lyase